MGYKLNAITSHGYILSFTKRILISGFMTNTNLIASQVNPYSANHKLHVHFVFDQ